MYDYAVTVNTANYLVCRTYGQVWCLNPLGLYGGLNVYRYASNSPVIRIDPYGFFDWPGMFGGSISNESPFPIHVYKEGDDGVVWRDVVPPGTPDNPSKSSTPDDPNNTVEFDCDWAWIQCECVKIGAGELDIGSSGQIKWGQHGNMNRNPKSCPPAPAECNECSPD